MATKNYLFAKTVCTACNTKISIKIGLNKRKQHLLRDFLSGRFSRNMGLLQYGRSQLMMTFILLPTSIALTSMNSLLK